jgi:predicted nuclease with TOPRIM domain
MNNDILTRLEALVEELLGRLKSLEEERDRLTLERETLLDEQQRIRAELDRILVKLEGFEQGTT